MESQQRNLAKIKQQILNTLFPEFCVHCALEGSVLCSWCQMNWAPFPLFENNIFSLVPYKDARLHELLQLWKYQGVIGAKKALLQFLERTLQAYPLMVPQVDFVTWVPLHAHKRNERGFDQAEEIALKVGSILNVPVIRTLKRVKNTESQALTDRENRQAKDFENCFEILDDARLIKGKKVFIVDDVCTTGTTLQAASNILLQAEPESVIGFVLARG